MVSDEIERKWKIGSLGHCCFVAKKGAKKLQIRFLFCFFWNSILKRQHFFSFVFLANGILEIKQTVNGILLVFFFVAFGGDALRFKEEI